MMIWLVVSHTFFFLKSFALVKTVIQIDWYFWDGLKQPTSYGEYHKDTGFDEFWCHKNKGTRNQEW